MPAAYSKTKPFKVQIEAYPFYDSNLVFNSVEDFYSFYQCKFRTKLSQKLLNDKIILSKHVVLTQNGKGILIEFEFYSEEHYHKSQSAFLKIAEFDEQLKPKEKRLLYTVVG